MMRTFAPSRQAGSRLLAVVGVAALAAAALWARPAAALTDEEVFRSFRFNQDMPGARETGMGGAAIGLANDATAMAINPAGIGFLSRPQAMMEWRMPDWKRKEEAYATAFDFTGTDTFGATPTQPALGFSNFQDDSSASPSYLAYVHPINDYFVVGVSRHERMHEDRKVEQVFQSSAFPQLDGGPAGKVFDAVMTRGRANILYDSFNVSFASAIVEQFSIGLTVGLARLDATVTHDNFGGEVVNTDADAPYDQFRQPIDYQTVMNGSATTFVATFGLLYRPHHKVGIGLVYRSGAQFDLTEQVTDAGARAAEIRQYLVGRGIADLNGRFTNRIRFPSSYGIGFSFGPFFEPRGGGGLMITADALRVQYSDVFDHTFVGGLNEQLFGPASTGSVTWAADDVTEFHLGVGYSWTVGYNNSVRVEVGGYTDPAHTLYTPAVPAVTVGASTVYPGFVPQAKDITHVTAGAGFTLKRGFYSFMLDGAADVSDVGTAYVGTASFKF